MTVVCVQVLVWTSYMVWMCVFICSTVVVFVLFGSSVLFIFFIWHFVYIARCDYIHHAFDDSNSYSPYKHVPSIQMQDKIYLNDLCYCCCESWLCWFIFSTYTQPISYSNLYHFYFSKWMFTYHFTNGIQWIQCPPEFRKKSMENEIYTEFEMIFA